MKIFNVIINFNFLLIVLEDYKPILIKKLIKISL